MARERFCLIFLSLLVCLHGGSPVVTLVSFPFGTGVGVRDVHFLWLLGGILSFT